MINCFLIVCLDWCYFLQDDGLIREHQNPAHPCSALLAPLLCPSFRPLLPIFFQTTITNSVHLMTKSVFLFLSSHKLDDNSCDFENTSPLLAISSSLFRICRLRSICFDFAHHQMHVMLFYTKVQWIVLTVPFTWVGPVVCHVLLVRHAMPSGNE